MRLCRAAGWGRAAMPRHIVATRSYMARIQLADAQVGDCFKREDRWWTVFAVLGNVKKGSETSQSKIILQDVLTGAKKEVRIKSAEKVEAVDMTVRECDVLRVGPVGKGGSGVVVRPHDEPEGEEMTVPHSEGHLVHYLTPGMKVRARRVCVAAPADPSRQVFVRLIDDVPIRVEPPKHVRVRVKSVPETAEQIAETKMVAFLENGRKVRVPGHITKGQEIVVRPADETYVGVSSEVIDD
jgi:translation elongation factor P/translation initiation factor 5A